MNDLLTALYHYAVTHQVEGYLLGERAVLEENELLCAASLERLEPALTPELRAVLARCLAARDVREDVRTEAFFLSGLSMGLSLGRLAG